eukprot:SAG22_NODE_12012_length_459_cov_1.913889_1_plen_80_part_10
MAFNQMSQICFFIPFGIGVDDMFIIVDKFEQLAHLPVEKRLEAALAAAGPSITLTTVTDIAAFVLGSTIDLPGVAVSADT